jgi:hypothetical protein
MHGTVSSFWTGMTTADLKEKIDLRWSAQEFADLHGISRNAAIGKANRMGWAFDPPVAQNAKHRATLPKRVRLQPKPRPQSRVIFDASIPRAPHLGVKLNDRLFNQCASPNPECDDPLTQTYCGQPTYGTLPYCIACVNRLYQPRRGR